MTSLLEPLRLPDGSPVKSFKFRQLSFPSPVPDLVRYYCIDLGKSIPPLDPHAHCYLSIIVPRLTTQELKGSCVCFPGSHSLWVMIVVFFSLHSPPSYYFRKGDVVDIPLVKDTILYCCR
ncbi:hypothetical protein L6452_18064 [Arctium lappa]|uniref:Uncharacterized protein n=1 Tax=Arctium lappa TaxID=4217 RepID=A0ACB9C508_ARCLA|nr:hypothetical protein L6452_18064 [Arctium lappa]